MKTQQEKFREWCAKEKAGGLIDFKLFASSLNDDKQTLEEVFRDLNEVNELLEKEDNSSNEGNIF
jgi:glutaredoxin 2